MIVAKLIGEGADHVKWWCPGCDGIHVVPIEPHPQGWRLTGDLTAPTLTPSVLVYGHDQSPMPSEDSEE